MIERGSGTDGGARLDSGTAEIEPWQVSESVWWGDTEEKEEMMTDANNWLQEARARAEAVIEPLSPFHPEAAWARRDAILACIRTDLPRALGLLAQAEKLLRVVEWIRLGTGGMECAWCKSLYPDHTDNCGREAWLARLDSGGDE